MTRITYIINGTLTDYTPTDEADALQVLVPIVGKYYRELSAGNKPYIEISEEEK